MGYKIGDIAAALGGHAVGNLDFVIQAASEPAKAGVLDLALAMDPKYSADLAKGSAKAAVLWADADWQALGLTAAIFVPRGRLAMAGLSLLLDQGPEIAKGIHHLCHIDESAIIGEGAAIGPFVSIGAGVTIGVRARIASHVSIGNGTTIGCDTLLLQGANLGPRVVIGDRFICQSGAVVGSDGFSFVTPEKSGAEEIRQTLGKREQITAQSWVRIHSLGSVTIGDDVELGANVCIDRGTVRNTVIGSGTKLDNLVHIGHNVEIGRDCLLCGQVGIAGSARLGDRVILAGQCGVNDNIFVGDDVIAGGATKILSNAPSGRVLLGYPAVKMETQIELNKATRRLPRLYIKIQKLQKSVENLLDRDERL
ncbi:MAG: UDP-3-O-(3-hydroxymyristoyl)glucosamine N-acyltransferase [Paracoccaceae bacterium]